MIFVGATTSKLHIIPGTPTLQVPHKSGDADALVRGRFATNRMTMLCMGDDASRVVMRPGRTEYHSESTSLWLE